MLSARTGKRAPATSPSRSSDGKCTVIIKEVPADVCRNCGEHYVSEEISAELQRRVEQAAGTGDEVTVLLYAA